MTSSVRPGTGLPTGIALLLPSHDGKAFVLQVFSPSSGVSFDPQFPLHYGLSALPSNVRRICTTSHCLFVQLPTSQTLQENTNLWGEWEELPRLFSHFQCHIGTPGGGTTVLWSKGLGRENLKFKTSLSYVVRPYVK